MYDHAKTLNVEKQKRKNCAKDLEDIFEVCFIILEQKLAGQKFRLAS